MCGIIGGTYQHPLNQDVLKTALATLNHRGPDAEGTYIKPDVFLGHKRLSIIDLDVRSNQPFRIGHLVLTYNGEIYNFDEIKDDLIRKGYVFSTTSDTEVLLTAFHHEGVDCLKRFEGMFAFAIWDEEKRQLTLVRDRFGEKPIYYYQDQNRFFFASEIPALETLVGRDKLEIDLDAIGQYFQFTYIPAPLSPYKNMYQLEPGSYLVFDAQSWSSQPEIYYNLTLKPRNISFDDAVDELRTRLTQTVTQRFCASDVPVATFLSGGIDSSILSALASDQSQLPIKAYSIGYPEDQEFDESPYARLVAEHCPGLEHNVIDVTERQLIDYTGHVLSHVGEPYADASIIPTGFLCSQVHEKVILGGDGADELFAGYGVYSAMRFSASLPRWLKFILLQLPYSKNPHSIKNSQLRAMTLFLSHLNYSSAQEYLSWRRYAEMSDLHKLGIETNQYAEQYVHSDQFESLNDILALDMRFNLPNDMLKKVDLASMKHSLEVRLPFLDSSLVEFALSLPEHFLIHKGKRKHILREAFKGLLPSSIFNRKKQGFLLPIRRWFQKGMLREEMFALSETSQFLNGKTLHRLLNEHQKGVYDHSVLLWSSFVYLKWLNRVHS